ncbi:Rox3p NDAI_0E03990 [Naumovozyma dairenensis CBS 421]|uniref:Mediator of RNA polymerase II transcription subunit 19 n=1 Tax=Naumovozyma dairenensis (strain ATCC 10597 / BCRC 20456 / CBS 421 / NBRC 0211 / NRRL Y-12639) TaxID=1071378 RepID=G0WBU6_NAUDC|nr:hypothetical protein NDAI_0E03990 [Naumovozyma dairenensis CBS 421]CCD25216.1 hypothetical protein NDAI_0E03990 [Naumovozyma dairenensis CBS 421]
MSTFTETANASSNVEQILPSYYYYVDPEVSYQPQIPNPLDDLISIYGLDDLSRQVARSNTETGIKAVKLRKSYKNQISDLSGKFTTIPTRENGKGGEISHILFQNNPDMMNQIHRNTSKNDNEWIEHARNRDMDLFQSTKNMDWNVCNNVISQFEKSYPSEFQQQQFNVDDLAFDLDGTGKNNGNIPGSVGNNKKRKNKSNGSSMATPNSDVQQEDLKRRRLE